MVTSDYYEDNRVYGHLNQNTLTSNLMILENLSVNFIILTGICKQLKDA